MRVWQELKPGRVAVPWSVFRRRPVLEWRQCADGRRDLLRGLDHHSSLEENTHGTAHPHA
jgi:hypothetical protein